MPAAVSLPPGPRTPRALQTLRFMREEPPYLDELHARYGDAFQINVERRPWNLLAHPDAIKQVFQAPPTVVHAGDANEILRNPLGRHSVLVLDEGEHMRQRKLLLPAFHGDRLREQRETMVRVAEAQVERMPVGRPFSLRPHTQAIALEVILEVVLGVSPAERERHAALSEPLDRFLDWFADTKHLLSAVVLGPDSRFVRRQHERISAPVDAQLYALIRDRREAGGLEERSDVLAMLLLARDEDGTPMSDEEIRDELVTLIVAGHETTATALAWAFERLTRHPADLRRLEDEARTDETEFARGRRQGDAAAAPGADERPAHAARAARGRRAPLPGGQRALAEHLPRAAPPRAVGRGRGRASGPRASSRRASPATPGSRSAAACAAASARRSRRWRWRSSCGRSPAPCASKPVGGEEHPIARFITSSPSRGGEVRVGARHARPAADEGRVAIAA